MDASTPEGRILAALKHELRAKGFHYRDIASRLKVHEATVKRYFTGKGVSLTVLRKLAEVADLDLLSLAALAERYAGERTFTKAQQAILGKSRLLSGIYFLLWHGWTPAQIRTEFEIASLDAALADLESAGFIRRQARDIKILATPPLDERGGGQLASLTRELARAFLSEINLDQPQCEWTFYVVRLSQPSVARLRAMINKFFQDARALTMSDAALPLQDVQWYRVFIGAQPVSRKRILPRS